MKKKILIAILLFVIVFILESIYIVYTIEQENKETILEIPHYGGGDKCQYCEEHFKQDGNS